MSRYIDADHFESVLDEMIDKNPRENEYLHHAIKMRNCAISEVKGALFREPTVDVMPVVRCKDCKLYDAELEGCYCWCAFGANGVKPDSFCSYGAKK